MRSKIAEIVKEEKISGFGICSVKDYIEKGLFEKASFCASGEKEELEGANSIIVCAFSYYNGMEKGNISRYAQGRDYHAVAREKMNKIALLLHEAGFFARVSADTGSLSERLLAKLSGIAFIGKNHMAINERMGSWFFLGYIATDCVLSSDEECLGECDGCGRCIAACPLGALGENFCEEKCLSYITQKRGAFSEEEASALRRAGTVWGCDICQEVCPHNKAPAVTEIDEFKENLILELMVDDEMSNREFKEKYKDRAFSWRGKSVLIRNQECIYNEEKIKMKKS